ncbi:hypothetical protein L9F63_002826 [Diploptera punctata]|uniref:Uncharacterized protein n=1 Tax=Diploptera punctata TaxID=6984 RepID=A0AAD7ZRJ9_DIPPU|nr:hypothetical protein L9F63_002826 [Diploptera punctata]
MKLIWYFVMLQSVVLISVNAEYGLKNCLYNIATRYINSTLTFAISETSQRNFDISKTSTNNTTNTKRNTISPRIREDVLDTILQKFQLSSKWPTVHIQTGNKTQNILQKRDGNYIFISTKDNKNGVINDIRLQAKITTKHKDSNPRSYYIIAVVNKFNNVTEVANAILSVLWKFKIINAIVLIPTENKFENNITSLLDVYTWFPFGSQRRCANVSDTVLLDRWVSYNHQEYFLNNTPLFPYKTPRNLNSCPLTVSTAILAPFIMNIRHSGEQITYEDGLEVRLLKEITSRMNMKLRYRSPSPDYWGVNLKNGSWSGVSGEVIKGLSDLAVLGYFNKAHLINGLEYSSPYLIDYLGWWVPCAKPTDRWKSLIIIFDKSLWLGFLAAYITVSIVIWIVAKLSSIVEDNVQYKSYESIVKCFLNFWAIIVEESASNNPPSVPAIRIIFLAWVLYCWAVNTVYQTYLVTFLVNPGYERQFATEQEILSSDISLGIVDAVVTCCIPDLEKYPLHRRYRCTNYFMCLNEIAKGHKLGFIFSLLHLQHVALTNYLGSSGNPLICPIAEKLTSQPVVMPFTKGSLFLERFDDIIVPMLEAGILTNWWETFKYVATLTTMSGLQEESEEYIKLSLQHLESVFIFLLMGYLFSCIVFVIELSSILRNKLKKKISIKM